jgi:hypothetical protein
VGSNGPRGGDRRNYAVMRAPPHPPSREVPPTIAHLTCAGPQPLSARRKQQGVEWGGERWG